MPPRYSYWTILAGGLPTAFRAADREELLPTFHRLREKHPDAELKYFAQGKLWSSPDDARAARARDTREERGRDWRPGGDHRDPRQKFKDEQKKHNQERRQQRFERKQAQAPRDERRSFKPDWKDRPPRAGKHHESGRRDWRERNARQDRPPSGPRSNTRHEPPREKPHGDRFERELRPPRDRRPPAKQQWSDRPPRTGERRDTGKRDWQGKRPWSDRPPSDNRDEWRRKPPREKPHGDPLRPGGKSDFRKPSTSAHAKGRDHRESRPEGDRSERAQRKWGERPKPSRNDRPRRREGTRNQEPAPHEPPHGPSTTREPRPSESPTPTPPPRPSEPEVPPPGPPERGRRDSRPFHGRFRR